MKEEIKYIELKSGYSDDGPAWISRVKFSKSGNTIYFNNMALKKLKSPGIGSNHFNIETGEEYWISNVKKNGQDRHWEGSGKILIDKEVVNDYLSSVDFDTLDKTKYEIIEIDNNFDKSRFNELENKPFINPE